MLGAGPALVSHCLVDFLQQPATRLKVSDVRGDLSHQLTQNTAQPTLPTPFNERNPNPMTTRSKIATTTIENGTVTFSCYSGPVAGTAQTVTSTLTYNVQDLATPTILDLAAFGFAAVAASRYPRSDQQPDVPQICGDLFAEMRAGNWKPGKRDTPAAEPPDLIKAYAEATRTTVADAMREFETRMQTLDDGTIYKDAAGKTRKYFSKATQTELAAHPKIAPILARLSHERAGAARTAPSNRLDGLFSNRP